MKTKIGKYAKRVLAVVLSLVLVVQAFNGLSIVSEATSSTTGYADVTFSDWGITSDADSSSYYTSGKHYSNTITNFTTLDNVAFNGLVTAPKFFIGGTRAWQGIQVVYVSTSGTMQFVVSGFDSYTGSYTSDSPLVVYPSGMDFSQENLRIRLAFDIDADTNDVTMAYAFSDGTNTKEGSCTFAGLGAYLGTGLLINGENKEFTDWYPEYNELTFSDFGIEDDTYTSATDGKPTTIDSMDEVAVSGKMSFSAINQQVRIGGTTSTEAAVASIYVSSLSSTLYVTDRSGGGLIGTLGTTALDTEVEVRVTFDYMGSDILIRVWVEDSLMQSYIAADKAESIQPTIRIDAGTGATVKSVSTGEYQTTSFENYGLNGRTITTTETAEAAVSETATCVVDDTALTSLDGVAFEDYIKFSGTWGDNSTVYFGGTGQWAGLRLIQMSDGDIQLKFIYGGSTLDTFGELGDGNLTIGDEIKAKITWDYRDDTDVVIRVCIKDTYSMTIVRHDYVQYMGVYLFAYAKQGYSLSLGREEEVAYTELQLSDWSTSAGTSDGVPIYSLTGYDDVTSLDHVIINAKVNFNGSKWLRIGGTDSVKHGGIWIGTHSSAGLWVTTGGLGGSGDWFPINATAWDELKNTTVKLRITLDKTAEGTWTVGLSVNGEDKGTYDFTVTTDPGMYVGINDAVTVDYTESGSDTVEMTNLTWENDFGIEYREYTSNASISPSTTDSLLNTYLTGKVTFNKVNETSGNYYICYAAVGTGWDGIRLIPQNDGTLKVRDVSNDTILDTIDVSDSLGGFIGIEFELGMEIWESGDDAKINIFINGEQYNVTPYKWENAVLNGCVGNTVKMIVSTEGDSIILGEEEPIEQLPTDFMEITLNDFGIADGTYASVTRTSLAIDGTTGADGAATLDKKILSMDVSCVDGIMQLFYGTTTSDYSGLFFKFNPTANTIALLQGTSTLLETFTAADGGFDLTNGNSVNLKITTEYVDGDDVDTDVKVGVFINGVLYNNEYIVIENFASSLSDYVSIHQANTSGSLTISTPKRMLPSTYDQKTFSDVGIGDKTDVTVQGVSEGYSIDWDGMIFSGKAAFGLNGSSIIFGASGGGWVGPEFIMKDGVLTFKHSSSSMFEGKTLATWENVTLKDVFSFSVVTKYVNIDGGEEENDLQLGLWVDGEMYGNRWFYILDFEMYEGPSYAISYNIGASGGNMQCTLISYLPSTTSGTQDNGKYYYNLEEGGYLLSTGSGITVNGVTKANGDVLDVAGDYTIIRTEGNAEYTSTVILYQTGDAHPDGKTSVADLVAAKKAALKIELTTESGLKGADANKDYTVDTKDVSKIRAVLLGTDTIDTSIDVPSLSYESGDAKVMPIGGYYGAYGDLLTEDVYKLIKESGINLVTWSKDTYNLDEDGTDAVVTQLTLAEKYGISLFIRDYALSSNNKTYTSQDLATKIAAYSMYQSFKGLTIADEPSATDGSYGSDKPLENYNALASSVNSYANLTGYTNLLPLATDKGTSTAYKNYLDEYCTTYNPKMLSFDDYPFNEDTSVTVKSCSQYFENLAIVRSKALEYDIPFWTFVQAGKWYNDTSWFSSDLTEAQMKWSANMALAFGAKGIQYFPMVEPTDSSTDFSGNGLISADGSTTTWYTYAQKINAQIAAVDDVLMESTSKGIMYDGTYAKSNVNNCGVTILPSFNELTGVTSNDTSTIEYGAVVGCFDYQGKTALYVVNYNTNGTNNVTLTFDATYSTQTITSSGVTTASGSSLKVTLAAGEAALVVIE